MFAACNALAVYTSVQPTGPTFATGLAVTSVLVFSGPGRRWPFLSGLLLGLAFACRFQDAFFGPVLLISGLLQRRFVASAFVSLGAAVTITLQGVVDLVTWGSFLHSPFRYGQEPFWFYLPLVALVLVALPQLVERKNLVSWIRSTRPRTPLYVLVTRTSIGNIEMPSGYAMTFEKYFADWPDVKSNTRRFLYRLESN